MYLERFALDPDQPRPQDRDWTGAEISACCRLAALLDVPLVEAARNIVPVAVTAGESVERLRQWASGRCLAADRPGLYTRGGDDRPARPQRPPRRSLGQLIAFSGAYRVDRDTQTSFPRSHSTRRAGVVRRLSFSMEALVTSLARPHRHPPRRRPAINDTATAARRLRTTMAACRVAFPWLGTQKTLTPEQRAVAAEAFDADGQVLSAGKKLLDTRHPAFRAVTAIRTRITESWKGQSLPFPEPGVRLIKQEHVEAFAAQLADFRVELDDAVQNLDRHYAELRQAAARAARQPVPRGRLPRDARGPVRRPVRLPRDRAAGLPGAALAGPVRAGAGAGGGAVRGGGAAGRTGVRRGVRPAGRAPGRADHRRRRRRQAEGLPRLGRRQPARSSSTGSAS